MHQSTSVPPSIHIKDEKLEIEHQFQYLDSLVTHNLSLDVELNKWISKAATMFSRVTKQVLENKQLITSTEIDISSALSSVAANHGQPTPRKSTN